MKLLSPLALVCISALALADAAPTAVPGTVQHVGRLLDGAGKPVTGLQSLTFSLWPNLVKTTATEMPLWTETYAVQLDTDGLYDVQLGGPTDDNGATTKKPFDATSFSLSATRFLEIAVNGETLTPRLQVSSVPYALTAGSAGDSTTLGGKAPAAYQTTLAGHGSLHVNGADLTIDTANATSDGALSSADWKTFSAKQGAITAAAPLALDPTSGNLTFAAGSFIANSPSSVQANAAVNVDGTITSGGAITSGAAVSGGSLKSTAGAAIGTDATVGNSLLVGATTGFVPHQGRVLASGASAELGVMDRQVSTYVELPTKGERWVLYADGAPATGLGGTLRIWSGGDKATFDAGGNLTLAGGLTTSGPATVGNLTMNGTDFNIKMGGSRGAGGRALVGDNANTLAINYGGDFSGGTRVDGPLVASGVMAGMFFAAAQAATSITSTQSAFTDILDSGTSTIDPVVTFTPTRTVNALVMYAINIQPDGAPGGGFVQVRPVVDGTPYPLSATHFQPYCSGDCNMNLTGNLVVPGLAANTPHTVKLQWAVGSPGTAPSWSNNPAWCNGGCGERTLTVLAFYQ